VASVKNLLVQVMKGIDSWLWKEQEYLEPLFPLLQCPENQLKGTWHQTEEGFLPLPMHTNYMDILR
jgi:hypothetical protein